MNRHHFREKALYRAANGAVLACAGLFMPFLGITDVTWKNILVLFAVLVFWVGISFLSVRGRSLCLLFAAVCLGGVAAVFGWHTSYDFLQAYLRWCGGYVGKQEQWLESFQLIHTAVITSAAFSIQVLLEKIRPFKNILAYICAGGLLFCLIAQVHVTHMAVVFIMLYIVLAYLEWLQQHWKKTRSGSLKAHMLWLSPFLCVYLLLMAVLPAPETPYDWQWAKNVYSHVRESFLTVSFHLFRGGHEDFNMALSGFSDEGELGEGVYEDNREVMHIQAKSSLMTNVYLIGKVYDTFDGRQWLQEYSGDEKERFIDTMETIYAFRRLDSRFLADYMQLMDIKIRYDVFNTEYVFAPLKTRSLQDGGTNLDYSFKGGDLVFKSRKGYGTEYDVQYYQINVGEEMFDQLLGSSTEPDEALWKAIANECQSKIGQEITLEMVESHRQMIYESYLEDVTISEEVKSYLDEITKDTTSDLERLRAIEKELSSYTYTRQPGKLSDKVTNASGFLDYFLLESRQGYCTYYATAFVLLARAEGFPARYVQGFCVPMKDRKETVVLSGMAHSWPEVYIDGVGWIPFEPSPGYGGLRYTPWEVKVRDNASSSEEKVGNATETEGLFTDSGKEPKTDEVYEGQESEEDFIQMRMWRALAIGISAIFVGFAVVLLLDNLVGMYRYRKMNPSEKLKVEVRNNLRVLAWLGLKRETQETLQQLRERGMLVSGLEDLRFIEDYEDALYGGKSVGENLLERVRLARKRLWRIIRKEKKLMYVFYRMRMFFMRYR